jgi:hypothetical protein
VPTPRERRQAASAVISWGSASFDCNQLSRHLPLCVCAPISPRRWGG